MSEISEAVKWLEEERASGRISEEVFQFLMQGCILVGMERKLQPSLDKMERRAEKYFGRLGKEDTF